MAMSKNEDQDEYRTAVAAWISSALMRKEGANQSKLAEFVGVEPQTVQQWLSGKTAPRPYRLKKIAEYFGEQLPSMISSNTSPHNDTITQAALLSWADLRRRKHVVEQNNAALGSRPCPVDCSSNTFVLPFTGVSMEPSVRDGEEIFVDPQRIPKHGDLVVADSEKWPEPRCRQYIVDSGAAYLRAMNSSWPEAPTPIDAQIEFVGVVVYVGRTPHL